MTYSFGVLYLAAMGRKIRAAAYGAAIGTVIGLAMAMVIIGRTTPAVASKSGPAIYIDDDRADVATRRT